MEFKASKKLKNKKSHQISSNHLNNQQSFKLNEILFQKHNKQLSQTLSN